jgi:hypothetical protein
MLDPDFISRLRPRNIETGEPERDEILDHLEKAMATGQKSAQTVDAVAKALGADPTLPEAAKALKVRNIALAQGEKAAAGLDAAKQRAVEAIALIDAEMQPDLPDESSEHLGPTILARLAAMPDEKRAQTVARAIASNDRLTLGVIFRAPAWLSGHGDSELDLHLDRWRRKYCREHVERLDRIKQAVAAVERGGTSLVAYVQHVAHAPEATLAAAAVERTSAAIAAAKEAA